MVVFKDWIFSLFPRYVVENDTYLVDGKGLFQRFIETFGQEIDEEIKDKVTNYLDITNVLTTDSNYLVYLAECLGNPPDMFEDIRYRKLLRYLVDIVKCKGTTSSYEKIFALLGCTITIEEIPPPVMRYDWPTNDEVDAQYDKGYKYDEECPTCSSYNLTITDEDGVLDGVLTNPILYTKLMKIIAFVEPINMRLSTLLINSDPVSTGDEWVLTTGVWDNGLYWNDSKIYKNEP